MMKTGMRKVTFVIPKPVPFIYLVSLMRGISLRFPRNAAVFSF